MSYARNADGELVDISVDAAKRMAQRLYSVPTATDEAAATIMAAADMILAQLSEIKTLRANHKDVVETKRHTDERLRAALAALQKVYDISGEGFERATAPRS